MIKGILFDLDGVILETERLGRAIYIQKCHEFGYTAMDEKKYEELLGKTRDEDREIVRAAVGSEFPFDEMYDAYRAGLYALAETGELPCKPFVTECMKGLKERGMRIALATSTARHIVEGYQKHIPQLRDVFDFMVCGAEAGRGKPAPDVYLKAAAGIGLKPEECIGVEDSAAGLQSQTAAGCVRVLIPDLLPNDERYAGLVDYCLDDLSQLCALVDRLNAQEADR